MHWKKWVNVLLVGSGISIIGTSACGGSDDDKGEDTSQKQTNSPDGGTSGGGVPGW